MFLFRSLRAKTLLWALLPLALVLLAAALIGHYGYEQSARDTVTQRDTELARVSAARLGEGLATHQIALQRLAAEPGIKSMDASGAGLAFELHRSNLIMLGVDIIVFDRAGAVVWAQDSAGISSVFLDPGQLDTVRRTLRPAFSDVFKLGISDADAVMVSVPILDAGNRFNGVLSGVSNIRGLFTGSHFLRCIGAKSRPQRLRLFSGQPREGCSPPGRLSVRKGLNIHSPSKTGHRRRDRRGDRRRAIGQRSGVRLCSGSGHGMGFGNSGAMGAT